MKQRAQLFLNDRVFGWAALIQGFGVLSFVATEFLFLYLFLLLLF